MSDPQMDDQPEEAEREAVDDTGFSEVEADSTPESTFIVSWYRAKGPGKRIVRYWAIGATVLLIGCFLMGVTITSLVTISDLSRLLYGIVGFTCVVFGPLYTSVGITRMMIRDEEALLIIRGDGIVFQDPPHRVFLSWMALNHAECEDEGNLLLHPEQGPPLLIRERFSGIEISELADFINASQRKALMGLLRPVQQGFRRWL